MSDLIRQLEKLAAIPVAEYRSRASALPQLLQGLNAAIVALHAADAVKVSSPEMSAIAAGVLGMDEWPNHHDGPDLTVEAYDELLRLAKRLAGSVLSQDETPGNGTHDDDPQDAINRNLAAAQLEGQAKPLVQPVPVIVHEATGTAAGTSDDLPLDGQ